MKWLLATVGEPKLAYAKAGLAEYLGRLQRTGKFDWVTVKASTPAIESDLLIKKTEDCFRVVLDERGKPVSTREFAALVESWQDNPAISRVALLVGGANGHANPLRERADFILSLAPWTLQHELAAVVLMEQVYRVQSLLRGEPYHRD